MILDETLTTVTAEGTEDFVIAIAQQLSWLAGVCQEKRDQLSYAYVRYSEENSVDTNSNPTFQIDVTLEIPLTQDDGSCWNRIVGPAVLVTGFSIPDRKHNERGLELSIPVMAEIAKIPQAVTFGGGIVFKGRYHALVPIIDFGSSVQWHLVDTYPERLEWAYIDQACPTRLRGLVNMKSFLSRRCFLGWCPLTLELLGGFLAFKYNVFAITKASKVPICLIIDLYSILKLSNPQDGHKLTNSPSVSVNGVRLLRR